MRAIQKILRQGNSAMVTLPRALMFALEWVPGDLIVLESRPDGTVQLRAWKNAETAQGQSPGVIVEPPPVMTR